jgi:hypothetical protein
LTIVSAGRHRSGGVRWLPTAAVLVAVLLSVLAAAAPAERTAQAIRAGPGIGSSAGPGSVTGVGTSVSDPAGVGGSTGVGSAASSAALAYPTALRIPAIRVATGLIRLSLDPAGVLQPPDAPGVAGWFAGGPVPGDVGPALLAGHIDSHAGPAVFFNLRRLRPGDEVQVDRSDGRTALFRVVQVAAFRKDRFPTEQVYAPTPLAELRLVTCGGQYDRAGRRYLDNIIVQAVLVN